MNDHTQSLTDGVVIIKKEEGVNEYDGREKPQAHIETVRDDNSIHDEESDIPKIKSRLDKIILFAFDPYFIVLIYAQQHWLYSKEDTYPLTFIAVGSFFFQILALIFNVATSLLFLKGTIKNLIALIQFRQHFYKLALVIGLVLFLSSIQNVLNYGFSDPIQPFWWVCYFNSAAFLNLLSNKTLYYILSIDNLEPAANNDSVSKCNSICGIVIWSLISLSFYLLLYHEYATYPLVEFVEIFKPMLCLVTIILMVALVFYFDTETRKISISTLQRIILTYSIFLAGFLFILLVLDFLLLIKNLKPKE